MIYKILKNNPLNSKNGAKMIPFHAMTNNENRSIKKRKRNKFLEVYKFVL